MESQSETTQTVSALKLPVLKTGDYDLWSMRMEQYLTHTDYALWEVYEAKIKGQSSSNSNSQNVAFVSSKNTSSTNEAINTAHEVSTASSQGQASSLNIMLINQGECYKTATGEVIFAREIMAPSNQWEKKWRCSKKIRAPVRTPANAWLFKIGIGPQDFPKCMDIATDADISINESFGDPGAKDKAGLDYDSQMNNSEVVHSVFNSRESDVDDSLVNDIFKTGEGFRAVLLPYTGNYMPSRPDLSFVVLDDSVYKTKVSETKTSISKDIIEKPKTVRPSALIIEELDTDSDNDSVFRPKFDQTKPKFTKINFVKSDENVKFINKENTHRQVEYPRKSQSLKDNRRNWNGMMTQKLGNGFEFIKKDCFICRSFNHLIKDCDFHDKKMVEKLVLNNKGKGYWSKGN
ncbi:hypothetical protein Tco_0570035 [Tanacetum coccineum]